MKIKKGLEKEYKEYVDKNKDFYGKGVVDFGERWANAMEKKLKGKVKVKDIASDTSRDVDTEGLTGFMYGCAVSALSHFWVHGEELRLWHNGEYGVGADKKGVVNPAILTVKM